MFSGDTAARTEALRPLHSRFHCDCVFCAGFARAKNTITMKAMATCGSHRDFQADLLGALPNFCKIRDDSYPEQGQHLSLTVAGESRWRSQPLLQPYLLATLHQRKS